MFAIEIGKRYVVVIPHNIEPTDEYYAGWQRFSTESELSALIRDHPSDWGVGIWNELATKQPAAEPIKTGKFRNRATAVERIWKRLCELYPDAVASEDMPKSTERRKSAAKARNVAKLRPAQTKAGWAAELETELRKRFKAGDTFELSDVYKLIPAFQRRHEENHHVAARLRTTLAQDLRGKGVVKTSGKGKYRMVAA